MILHFRNLRTNNANTLGVYVHCNQLNQLIFNQLLCKYMYMYFKKYVYQCVHYLQNSFFALFFNVYYKIKLQKREIKSNRLRKTNKNEFFCKYVYTIYLSFCHTILNGSPDFVSTRWLFNCWRRVYLGLDYLSYLQYTLLVTHANKAHR